MLQIRTGPVFSSPALWALGLSNGEEDPLHFRGIVGVFCWFKKKKMNFGKSKGFSHQMQNCLLFWLTALPYPLLSHTEDLVAH